MDKLSEKALEAKRAYQYEWNRKNPEKIKQYQNTYWEKKAKTYSIDHKAKELREQGLTQRDIAKALKVSLGAVNKILNKK